MCIKCTHAPRAAAAAWIEAQVVVTQLRATVAALSLLPPPSDCIRDADRGSSGGDSTPSYDGCYGRRLGSAGSRYFFVYGNDTFCRPEQATKNMYLSSAPMEDTYFSSITFCQSEVMKVSLLPMKNSFFRW
jgi:hypothetical protein